MLSFWERESLSKYDYVIIGGGIVGCSTAYHLKKKKPKAEIAIIERGVFPSGASSKNAGFACFGSLTELVDDRKGLSDDEQLTLVEKRWKGLLALRNILGEKNIGFEDNGGFEVIRKAELPALEYLDHYNQLLRSIFKKNVYSLKPNFINEFGFNKSDIETIVSNPFEGQIDTGKMMKSWWSLCSEMSIKIITGCELKGFEEKNDYVNLNCQSGNQSVQLQANKIAICTNAFAHKWFNQEDINPGRGMVLVTDPIEKLKFKGVFHYDEGYFYFRNVGNRVLIGGGRNLDKSTEDTVEFGINPKIKLAILHDLKELILPNQDFSIDMEWSGIMAFGAIKSPIIKKISDKIAIGVRLGGMGVAIGTQVGKELHELLADG
ncbi:FAD-dependent oxidoreductase [Marivirga tractuosa]|uniref:FAD dependent oxidoreductase n=1 Tax=Marivirga tractuosa (strain ATCC 23168 / DSM 4126 / NBRC 15989 / NCIMB 1408 / VKM B-1430 / H-43) TaxID=643867 RepID=E4TUQ1_MARTH|nr:FAD-dependent oxidoreductase [Marivirga tractuosa]ADR20029.1 FAD dependent oxidoreductase [Marivirga tractuosa DSM 4126]BDD15539.1 FAD-dependent oxidoreductase [Marivirga tractuosa]